MVKGAVRAWIGLTAVALLVVASPRVAGAQAKWPSSSPPRALAARDVKFPAYEVRTLPNGLTVAIVSHNEQPAVSVRAIVRAGAAQDPPGRLGVAWMVANLIDQGTETRSALEVADAIDSAGGELKTGSGRDLSFASVTVMKDGLALGMTLLADVLRRPAFAQEELDRQRRQLLAALRVSYTNPDYLAGAAFDRLVYGAHPYGYPGDGTPATVDAMTRDDLVAFHRRYYAPNNCLVAVVGDVTAEEAMAAVTRAFGDWPRRDVPPEAGGQVPKPTRRVVVIDKPDAVQTEIRMGHASIARQDKEYVAMDLAARILGGEGANRLHQLLRAERGLTYGAEAVLETFRRGGALVAQTNTRTETTGEVLRLMADEFWRLRRDRVGDRELDDAKAYMTGHFPLDIETPNQIASRVLDVLFYELPVEQLQTFRARVDSVTPEQIEWLTNRNVQPDRLSVVLVGNAAGFLEQLKRVGFTHIDVIKLSDLDLAADDLRRKPAEPVEAGRGPRAGR